MKNALLIFLIVPTTMFIGSASATASSVRLPTILTIGEYMSGVKAEAQVDAPAVTPQISTTTFLSGFLASAAASTGIFFQTVFANTMRFVVLLRDGSHYEVAAASMVER